MTNLNNNNTVLVVDDSDIIRNSLKGFFSDYRLDVITSSDGLDGIQKVMDHKPALIFLDLLMPNFDGIKMLQVIKVIENIKNIPVIVISGNTNRTNVLAAIEAGADRVVSKPLKKEIIVKNINELLGPEFLAKAKKTGQISKYDQEVIMKKLRESFLKSFPERRTILERCLKDQNSGGLKKIAHDLKGEGGMIGDQKLSFLGGLIEDRLGDKNINWNHIKTMCNQVFAIVADMENLNLHNTE